MTRPMTQPVPEGPEQTLRALARAMFRAAAAAAVLTTVGSVVVAAVLAGPSGVLGALAGSGLAFAATLITLVLIRRTAALPPQAVMIASYGGLLTKAIFLLAGLFVLDGVDAVDRWALALSMLAMFIAVTTAQGWASYRMPTLTLDPMPASDGGPRHDHDA